MHPQRSPCPPTAAGGRHPHERQTDSAQADGVEPVNLKDALEKRYLEYALSTITKRAVPGVRDRPTAPAPAHPLRHAQPRLIPKRVAQ